MRFEVISPWVERPPDMTPRLQADLHAEVVVIGGGLTGLSTALALRAQGVEVVVLEREFAGSGASGRHAGHLTPTIGKDLPTLLRLFGKERAAALARFADAAVEYTESLISKHGIACEYVSHGNVLAAVLPKQCTRLQRAADTGATLGAHVRFLSRPQMRERGLPDVFCCGVLEEKGGTLHPGRYVHGLRSAVRAAGARLFEQTPVLGVEDGPHIRLQTPGATVTAEKIVVATNAYTPQLPWLRRAVLPLRVSLFETEPLSEERLERLGWKQREGIYTAHESLESYRLTAHDTIVGGSKIVHYAYGSRLEDEYVPATFARLEAVFRERFPTLRDLPLARFWGGWIAFPLDTLPWVGVTGRFRNVYYGLGYAGHGVAQATLMGPMLADLVQGREHPHMQALTRRRIPVPPEPLRWLTFQAVNGALSWIDARTDHAVRAATPGAKL